MNDSATIGLIAAMPEEINPLLKRIGTYQKKTIAPFTIYNFSLGNKKYAIIRSGMGAIHAAAAARLLIREMNPAIIISFGFAGAITIGPRVGDLIIAEKLFNYQNSDFSPQPGLTAALFSHLQILLQARAGQRYTVYPGTVITTTEIVEKKGLAKKLPGNCRCPVLDMETAAVAQVAANARIPFSAIRAISDPADEELGFSIEEFTDIDLNIRLTKVLATVVKKPWIVPQLLRLARNSNAAGKNLALAIEAVIKET